MQDFTQVKEFREIREVREVSETLNSLNSLNSLLLVFCRQKVVVATLRLSRAHSNSFAMPRRSNEGSPKASQGTQEAERAAYCSVCEQLGYEV